MKQTFTRALLAVALSAVALPAAAVSVSPLYTVYEPTQKAGVLKVANTEATDKTYQVVVEKWVIENGEQVRKATDEIRFAPAVFTIKPGKQQSVRWAVRGAPAGDEKAYRVAVREVPDLKSMTKGGVYNLINVDAGWFWRSDALKPDLSAKLDAGSVVVTNRGRATARLVDLVSGGEARNGLIGYVLPGETRSFKLDLKKAGSDISVKVNDVDSKIPLGR